MTSHARLAPSAAARWLVCPGSVRLAELMPPPESSSWAEEGTRAHAVAAELLAGAWMPDTAAAESAPCLAGQDPEERAQMEHDLQLYVDVVGQLIAETGGQLSIEQRYDTGIPGCYGTADAVIVSDTRLVIVDLKYGAGVQVDARENPQLRLYALGAYRTLGAFLELERIDTIIVQPRAAGGHVSAETLTPEQLESWGADAAEKAAQVDAEVAVFAPSLAGCRWCPAAGRCRALAARVYQAADVADVAMSDEDLAEALELSQMVKLFQDRTERAALRRIYDEGGSIDGWKVVAGSSRRTITDEHAALETLLAAGYAKGQVVQEALLSLTALDRVLGPDMNLLAPYMKRRHGKPTLVPATDRRRPITPETTAQDDFADIN